MAPRLMQGSDAVADAAILAGCRFFTGYPMLPFTELLENMAKKLPAAGGVCINAESEIEGINMALGAAATGARAATGSCGQGVSLMQEGIAELALNELPLVVFTMARGQQDYFQCTRGGGWGDYRTITLAPKDIPEAVAHTQELFYLADLYRTPVILYGDYVIAHTSVGIEVEPLDFGPLEPKDWALDGTMSGTGRARQIWTWNRGKPNTPGVGPDRAWNTIAEKYAHIEATEQRFETYRADDAEVLIVSFGTTSVFVDRVVDDLREEGLSIGSFRPITLWPFPAVGLEEVTKGKRHVLVYELNAGQMVDDVRMYAHERSVIRSIGGVSQDESGMRQGDLLNADELRQRVRGRGEPVGRGHESRRSGSESSERSRMTTVDITTAPERAAHRVAEVQAEPPAVLRARSVPGVRASGRVAPGARRTCRARARAPHHPHRRARVLHPDDAHQRHRFPAVSARPRPGSRDRRQAYEARRRRRHAPRRRRHGERRPARGAARSGPGRESDRVALQQRRLRGHGRPHDGHHRDRATHQDQPRGTRGRKSTGTRSTLRAC